MSASGLTRAVEHRQFTLLIIEINYSYPRSDGNGLSRSRLEANICDVSLVSLTLTSCGVERLPAGRIAAASTGVARLS